MFYDNFLISNFKDAFSDPASQENGGPNPSYS